MDRRHEDAGIETELESVPPNGDFAMKAILKALGLTIWGLIAIGLLATFVFVGYEAAIMHRASSGTMADEGTSIDRSEPGKLGPSGGITSTAQASRTKRTPHASVPPSSSDATRN